jgi:glutathione synthase/RimK-type ligase-like ATP-grasp enzyme
MSKTIELAIHDRPGSFSDYWIEWCRNSGVPFKIVNAYATNLLAQIKNCHGLMWHWHQDLHADQLFARQLALALRYSGLKLFPNVETAWHFDDKLAQKYLFEAAGIAHVPTYVFYSRDAALAWLSSAQFPLVFKLRNGAGSMNVQLVKEMGRARHLVNRAFSRGFPVVDVHAIARQAFWEFKRDRTVRRFFRALYYRTAALTGWKPQNMRLRERQRGYVYFQDFIPNNRYDDRLVVIGERCFCIRRFCRDNDFRASGSGVMEYLHTVFPKESLQLAFSAAKKLNSQCLAMDVLYNDDGQPLIGEVSYCFVTGKAYENCDGYFSPDLEWHDVKVRPQIFMIEDFYKDILADYRPNTPPLMAKSQQRRQVESADKE